MKEEKQLPSILAKTGAEFAKMEAKLNKLPYAIISQIESVRNGGVGLECVIETRYLDKISVLLPNFVTQITDFGDYIGIYCGEFFFKIEKKETLKTIDYVILNDEQMKFYLKQDKE